MSRSDTRQSAAEKLPQGHSQQACGRKERPGRASLSLGVSLRRWVCL